jgi:uncharacterized protein
MFSGQVPGGEIGERLHRLVPIMTPVPVPPAAAWHHRDARQGFEVVYFQPAEGGYRIDGYTTAVENDHPWVVQYAIMVDTSWTTRSASVTGRWPTGTRQIDIEADGHGRWHIDGAHAAALDGCLDVDLESSSMTNALPARRLGLRVGDEAYAPAAYVRALDLSVERLEQQYVRVTDEDGSQRYDYSAPAFDFSCRLVYDASGLPLDYPGIGVRAF